MSDIIKKPTKQIIIRYSSFLRDYDEALSQYVENGYVAISITAIDKNSGLILFHKYD